MSEHEIARFSVQPKVVPVSVVEERMQRVASTLSYIISMIADERKAEVSALVCALSSSAYNDGVADSASLIERLAEMNSRQAGLSTAASALRELDRRNRATTAKAYAS